VLRAPHILLRLRTEIVALTAKQTTTAPERFGGPFMIQPFTDSPVNDRLCNGHRIVLQDQDLRWCLRDTASFNAWWVGNNEVMFQIPSASHTHHLDQDAESKGKTNAGDVNPRIAQATNVTRNAINNDSERRFKFHKLVLPTFHDEHKLLDNSVFSPGTENNLIKVKVIVLESKFDVPSKDAMGNVVTKQIASCRADIVWDIAIWEKEHRAATAAAKGKNDQADQIASQLGGMNISQAPFCLGCLFKCS